MKEPYKVFLENLRMITLFRGTECYGIDLSTAFKKTITDSLRNIQEVFKHDQYECL